MSAARTMGAEMFDPRTEDPFEHLRRLEHNAARARATVIVGRQGIQQVTARIALLEKELVETVDAIVDWAETLSRLTDTLERAIVVAEQADAALLEARWVGGRE